MDKTLLRSRLAWSLIAANLLAIAAILWISRSGTISESVTFAVRPVSFAQLAGWAENDPHSALDAFRRSCAALLKLPPQQVMGWNGYAGNAADWRPACAAIPAKTVSNEEARTYFEAWFAPVAVEGDKAAHFTGYYEPQLSVSWSRNARFRVPIYGRPSDLISADLGEFHAKLAGQHISGRVAGSQLVPYQNRANIDANGLPTAPG